MILYLFLTVVVTVAICGIIHFNILQQRSFKKIREEGLFMDNAVRVREITFSEIPKHESYIEELESKTKFYVESFFDSPDRHKYIVIPDIEATKMRELKTPGKKVYRAQIRMLEEKEVHDFFFRIVRVFIDETDKSRIFLRYKVLNNLEVLSYLNKHQEVSSVN